MFTNVPNYIVEAVFTACLKKIPPFRVFVLSFLGKMKSLSKSVITEFVVSDKAETFVPYLVYIVDFMVLENAKVPSLEATGTNTGFCSLR